MTYQPWGYSAKLKYYHSKCQSARLLTRNATESSNPGVMQLLQLSKRKAYLEISFVLLLSQFHHHVQPLVGIEDALDCLHSASYFCGFAIRVPANPNVELNVMLFGLCKAPATSERFMDTIL